MGPILFIVAVIAAIATAAWLGHKANKARQEAMAAFARDFGLSFDPSHDTDHDDEYAQFEIFRRGHSRVAMNTMAGAMELFGRPCRVRCGDFRYKVTTTNGKQTQTTTHNFSYLIVHPPWDTPPLLVRPEGLFDKLKGAFGFDDIDFESVEFSKKFYVQSTDKRFAYDVLHPRMMEFLMAKKPPAIDIEHGALCLSDGSRRWDPAGFRQHAEFVQKFCELWPRHLVKDLET